jgi:oligo-1,6-glucosidase
MVNWWLDKGLAGFRIDAIINIKKDLNFPDYEPDGPDGLASCTVMVDNVDGVGDFLQELKHETFDKYDAFTVGEVFNMKEDELEEFVGEEGHFSTMFDFGPHILTYGDHGWYDAKKIEFHSWRDTISRSQERAQGIGFLANIIENHDEPRGVCRYLPEHARDEKGKKMLATTSVLLRGLPFLFQGQEIGMENCVMNDVSEYNDISTFDHYQMALDAGCSVEEAMACCYENSRDNSRTPMQWSDGLNAGFSKGTPWIKVNPNYTRINVAAQEKDGDYVLSYYK